MDTSQRKTLSLKLDFMDLFFGISNFSAMNLIPSRNLLMERRKKPKSFNTQEVNFSTDGKLKNVHDIKPKTWLERLYYKKTNLGNYSPSLTSDLAKAIEKSMPQINNIKYPNKIMDEFNSEKIASRNNIGNLIYSKIGEDIDAIKDRMANYLNEEFKLKTTYEKRDITNCEEETEMTIAESKKSTSMEEPLIEKPQVVKTLRKSMKQELNKGKGRGKIQSRGSSVYQLKHKKERLKQNLYCNIQDDMEAWAEDLQEFPEIQFEDPDIVTNSTYYQLQPDIIQNYQSIDADYPSLPQHSPMNAEPKIIKRISKRNYDSPIQSPKDCLSSTYNFRSRLPSESSIDSEESCCIVFQDDSESNSSKTTDSDYESSSGEESEDDDSNDHLNSKVRFNLKPKIHNMIQWDFAYRAARRGPWEEIARDRERFRCRINCVSEILNPILSLQHREQAYQNRFNMNN